MRTNTSGKKASKSKSKSKSKPKSRAKAKTGLDFKRKSKPTAKPRRKGRAGLALETLAAPSLSGVDQITQIAASSPIARRNWNNPRNSS